MSKQVCTSTGGRRSISQGLRSKPADYRPIALNRKNALFAGHDARAENWAVIASLIETCKLNGVDPHAWQATTLRAIAAGHKNAAIGELLPWNYAAKV